MIAADRRNNSVFYAGSGNEFYASSDAGSIFTKSSTLSNATSIRNIAPHPSRAGEAWASTDAGVFQTRDFGATFTHVGRELTNTYQIAFGLASGNSSKYSVYAFGYGPAGPKLYASTSYGATWIDIQGDQGFGDISNCKLAGSGNVPGQVYVGTNGRSVFYRQTA